MIPLLRRFLPLLLTCTAVAGPVPVGVARVDITPALPIRLSGYTNRPAEADRVVAPLSARALALGGDDGEGPVVLVVAEVLAVSEEFTAGVLADLQQHRALPRARFALAVTHQHTGPVIAGTAPFMFSRDLPPEELARIDAYAAFLRTKLVEVARAALAARQPAGTGRGQPVARCALKIPAFRHAASLGATRNRRTPSFIRLAGRRPRCLWTPISARSAGCAL